MIKPNAFAKDADQVGYFEPSEESELFAKRLVSAISKGGDHISLTLTGKGAIAFARELSERLLAEKSQKAESNVGTTTNTSRRSISAERYSIAQRIFRSYAKEIPMKIPVVVYKCIV